METTLTQAVKAAAAVRIASAHVRREQMQQIRTAVRMHMGQNHDRRHEVSDALVRLRQGWAEFRTQMRVQLRALKTRAHGRRKARA